MRLKEDAMLNGQLKPAYNLQNEVDAQYITWLDISAHPSGALTRIPFLKDMEDHLLFKYKEIVTDAGYEKDECICSNGRHLKAVCDHHRKNGYIITITIYECENCCGCPNKETKKT